MLSDLPRDLAEDVLIRLPLTSNRVVRSVCKQWKTLIKGRSFTKKHLAQAKAEAAATKGSMVVMLMCGRVYLMSVNLDHKGGVDPSINRQGKLISSLDDDEVNIFEVYHCDGLLLCVTSGPTKLIVCNPYCGQTSRSFEPINWHHIVRMTWYAIGYDESSSSKSKSSCSRRRYKVLRFGESYRGYVRYELYYINSNGSSTFRVTIFPDWYIECYARGVSVKGNTYWFAQEDSADGGLRHISEIPDFLICFDFTTEAFGPRLTLPFHSNAEDTVTLSSVRDEQLAVLYQCHDTLRMEIWITTKIEPQVASWSKLFLEVNMDPLIGYQFGVSGASFFVDEEKKVAMVLAQVPDDMDRVAYIIGEDGYFKKVDLGESSNLLESPLMCAFVPSLVQIKRSGKRKRKPIIDCL